MPTQPSRSLETFPNPEPGRDYLIRHECPEYTAICPVTGHSWRIRSLKLYLWSFRNEGHYFEQVTNQILDDLVKAVKPRRMTVIGDFNVRGGISSRVVARYEREGMGSERATPAPRAPRRSRTRAPRSSG